MKKYYGPEMFVIELSDDVVLMSGVDPFKNDINWGGGLEDDA